MNRKNFFWLREHYGQTPTDPSLELDAIVDQIEAAALAALSSDPGYGFKPLDPPAAPLHA